MPLFGPPNIGELKARRDVEGLIQALGHKKDAAIRQQAALALGDLGDRRAVASLNAALRDEDWYVRWAAAEALGQIGNAHAVRPLITALRDEDVRAAAAEALVKIGAPAVEPLIAALKDKSWEVRRAAAESLGKIGNLRAVELLSAALKDEFWEVRRAAAEALGKIGDPRAVAPLIAVLRDRDVNWSAAEALGKIGDPRAVKPLVVALRDCWLHQPIAEALCRIGDIYALEQLGACIADENIRLGIVHYLTDLDNPSTLRPLLLHLQSRWGIEHPPAADVVDILIAALNDENENVRHAAAKALGKRGDARAAKPLMAAFNRWQALRWHAAIALGDLGEPRAAQMILDSYKDCREHMREKYLGFGCAEVMTAIAITHEELFNSSLAALTNIGTPAVEPLIAALQSTDEDTRRLAIQSLEKIDNARVIEPVIAALKDPDSRVRQAAAQELAELGLYPGQDEN